VTEPGAPPGEVRPKYGCIGCLMLAAGFFGGGIIAVLIGKIVGNVRGCVPPAGLPACDWHLYAGAGGAVGALLLAGVVLFMLRRGDSAPRNSDRG
jgi:hypothetical protein